MKPYPSRPWLATQPVPTARSRSRIGVVGLAIVAWVLIFATMYALLAVGAA